MWGWWVPRLQPPLGTGNSDPVICHVSGWLVPCLRVPLSLPRHGVCILAARSPPAVERRPGREPHGPSQALGPCSAASPQQHHINKPGMPSGEQPTCTEGNVVPSAHRARQPPTPPRDSEPSPPSNPLTTPLQTDRRLGLFVGGHYAAHNLSAALDRARLRGGDSVRMTLWSAPGQSKPSFDEAVAQLAVSDRQLSVGDELGPSWTNHWVRVDLAIPASFADSGEPVICESDARPS